MTNFFFKGPIETLVAVKCVVPIYTLRSIYAFLLFIKRLHKLEIGQQPNHDNALAAIV